MPIERFLKGERNEYVQNFIHTYACIWDGTMRLLALITLKCLLFICCKNSTGGIFSRNRFEIEIVSIL
jgi:hypothetical protein